MSPARRLRISILIHNVYGVGGTNRAVINLSEALSRRGHDVEIVSVFRRLDRPTWDIDPAVKVTGLVDTRPGSADSTNPLQWQRSVIVPPHEEYFSVYSLLTDQRLRDHLRGTSRDVVIGTRPALNLAVATWATDSIVRVAQEHQTHATLPAGVRAAMAQRYPRLHAAITVTTADAEAFRATTPVPGLLVDAIPNSAPEPDLLPAGLTNQIVMAAGRLDPVKRYDLLLRAFALVAADLPGWQLRIHGGGAEEQSLRQLIVDLDIADRALLMGQSKNLDEEWVKASVGVSTSERESFGMSVVEAMRCGLPVVSTRAPVGPEEIIRDGEDGLLVRVNDVRAVADALRRLCRDDSLRQVMGACARLNAARYDPEVVAERYESLLTGLRERLDGPHRRPGRLLTWGRALVASSRSSSSGGRPPVRCRVTANDRGDLDFVVPLDGVPRPARLRFKVRGAPETVEVPLTRDGQDLVAHVEASALPEARWNTYLVGSGDRALRLPYDVVDLRAATRVATRVGQPFRRLLPYRPDDDGLAVRSWARDRHAECRRLTVEDGWLVVEGQASWTTRPPAHVQPRARRLQGAATVVDGEPAHLGDDGFFEVRLDLEELAACRLTRHDDWHLVLVADDGSTARLSRLADDVVDRKNVYRFPTVICHDDVPPAMHDESPGRVIRARPYFTVDSDLAVSVVER